MSEDLYRYYEDELRYVRQLGADFARKHPRAARRLMLNTEPSADECPDPHVERLIQSFAFIAAGVHRRLDDDFPELTSALLGVVAPHLIAPIPSMTVVQFEPDAKLDRIVCIPRGSFLETRPIDGSVCRFRTGYPVTLWPLTVGEPRLEQPGRLGLGQEAAAVLRLELRCRSGTFSSLLASLADRPELAGQAALRFYLHGGDQFELYDLLMGQTREVLVRDKDQAPGGGQPVSRLTLRQAGFEREEALLPGGPRSLDSYRLLSEYFACPKRFLFFDLDLGELARARLGRTIEVLFLLQRHPGPNRRYAADSFRLGCTPAVNLFPRTAEEIIVDQTRTEYLIEPSVNDPDAYEVHSVRHVASSDGTLEFSPLYSLRHASPPAGGARASGYYVTARRPSSVADRPRSEVHLSFVDLTLRPSEPAATRVLVSTLCTNGDLPRKTEAHPDFALDSSEVSAVAMVHALAPPGPTRRPGLGPETAWRLVSQLSLNYLSLGDAGSDGNCDDAVAALREILLLHAAHAAPDSGDGLLQQIQGITEVRTERIAACPRGHFGPCRGLQVRLTFNPESYRGASVLLMATVLERFLARYASINSFTQLVALNPQGEELKRWPPRSGDQLLL